MANFGWAYVNCTDESGAGTGGQADGPTGSIQFLTGHNSTNGTEYLMYHTASDATVHGYSPSTLVLSGNLIVTGAVSASVFTYKDITVIDATGSTNFGDGVPDKHTRTGSFEIGGIGADPHRPIFSASATDGWIKVAGFAGRYQSFTTTPYTLDPFVHIYGLQRTTAQRVNVPAASSVPPGFFWIIKDEVTSRIGAGNNITLTSSSPIQNLFDGEPTYVLTGTMPAISLYSNGTNWFVF